ncbi:PepSY-like domain-containing protein [Campylobacter cuniculorum]|uniref:PepSY-like domain-containing protein n=1 Tax=Campylobacter cuniculorum TaxID=374106 RepID=A0ABX6TW54_9BACT|nr:PepSY-like domain-containing protein [Campylobacter cuniculorum]QOR04032.1 PepSY-like domain-containing protein [Campylobacter cuniculorum]
MDKTLKFIFLTLILLCVLFADFIISPESLPPNAKEFLQKNFNAQIGIVQVDKNNYEVYLSDGTELEFDMDGSWREIESKFNPLNFNILPPILADIIKNNYPNATMLEIKKKINYYKIQLNNGLKVIIDFNGTILHQEFDD